LVLLQENYIPVLSSNTT